MLSQRWAIYSVFTFFFLGLFFLGMTQSNSAARPANPVAFKRSSSAIAITADGVTLLTVNPDSNSITLIDTLTQMVIKEISVGIDPRTITVNDNGDRAYVANRGSDSVSVLDLAAHEKIAEVPVGQHPYGVVVSPTGDRLYIAEQGSDTVSCMDTATFGILSTFEMGDRPSGLAIRGDGNVLYVSHLLTNQISVIDLSTEFIYLPLILRSNLIESQPKPEINNLQLQAAPSFHQITPITLWPDSNLVQSIIISPDGQLAYIPHTRSNTSNRVLTFDTTVFPLVSLIDLNTNTHLIGQQLNLGTLDPPGIGLPFDGAVTPDGVELWILNAASNDITVIDLTTKQRITHIEVGDNPRGIVLSPDGSTAYVNNTLSGTVSVIDTATYTVTNTIATTQIPLPPLLLRGKQLFHSSDDPRVSNAQWISCNTCHFDGEVDGRTWFFGFSGPRNTTSLTGMIETYPLRWSGEWDESADSEFANRKENFGSGLIEGEMNCSLSPPDCVNYPPNQGRNYDLDALAAFIDSLLIPLSPAHAHGEPLTQSEQRGEVIFNDPIVGCVRCHPAPLYTDKQKHDVGTVTPDERIGPDYDTPSLRGLYDSAPYFHDGSAATLYETLTFPSLGGEHDVSDLLNDTEIQDLIAFLLALPFWE